MFMLTTLISVLAACPVQTQVDGTTKPAKAKTQQQQVSKTSTEADKVVVKKPVEVANMASISLAGRKTNLNVRHWPSIGNPRAKYVFVEMFDYTCPHCKNTHKAIEGAIKKYGDDLAIVVLPVPLNASCNSSVQYTNAKHMEACEVARIAISVWRCKPSSFHKFHDWMFASPNPRTAYDAKKFGGTLVGADKLQAEMAKPYASQYIARHVQLYQQSGAGAVPKLMFPAATLVGEVTSSQTLVDLIARQFPNK